MSASNRRDDIDRLRVVAVLLLMPFHTARIFDFWELFYATSNETCAALGHGTEAQYVHERFTRLLGPFLFGVIAV